MRGTSKNVFFTDRKVDKSYSNRQSYKSNRVNVAQSLPSTVIYVWQSVQRTRHRDTHAIGEDVALQGEIVRKSSL